MNITNEKLGKIERELLSDYREREGCCADIKEVFALARQGLRLQQKENEGRSCSVCAWTNNGCLNLGNPNEKPKWVCHGCIKRGFDQLSTLQNSLEAAKRDTERLKDYTVEILQDGGDSPAHVWIVNATTDNDAIQLAFALDGGWSEERDASEMLQLALSHCLVTSPDHAINAERKS